MSTEGWEGWDEYAPFYDWENARTLGRRDVPFWRRVATSVGGTVLELGCGTGRVSLPLARAGVDLIGVDRSTGMLTRMTRQLTRSQRRQLRVIRADIRALPFSDAAFGAVLAPYGILQSLIRPRDLTATLSSVARILQRGGTFGIDLVPDVANWREYRNQVRLRGRAAGRTLSLIESVRHDRARRLTVFEERFVERRGRRSRTFSFDLVFRTLSVPAMTRRLRQAGFEVDRVLGDYRGGAWSDRSGVWIILAKKV